jgi:hypothetical protein
MHCEVWVCRAGAHSAEAKPPHHLVQQLPIRLLEMVRHHLIEAALADVREQVYADHRSIACERARSHARGRDILDQ